ncbi:Holliday junction resolvase RecU [Vagococcus xieshaowenii]|uniref:Holliday junction resolvase RecU n=1 Tax=Vagococcus xieshaowenii TaxID=2562451 RepID=A0A4Z0D6W3_9ENTE|nr:Holliday junction resolvase RecU [Vagococcus xieshaowenii]QCA28573.1 Holliday junction resolvase RecU [Vagococcus xieshaowenii]TFZ40619.1 Holliday junction resolvase RecU [Vagococcus xieshaowenii]
MAVNYPNGQRYQGMKSAVKRPQVRQQTFGNRGMTFEQMINDSNDYYLSKGVAVIHKKPTPIQIVKVDYPKRSAATIKEAYFKQASTTDYNGVYQGKYLDFEAKETQNKTSFPLSNIHQHQIDHMQQCLAQQGLVFLLVYFSTLKECYLLEANDLLMWWNQKDLGKKSIPYKYFQDHVHKVPIKIAPRIAYLEIIDTVFRIGENDDKQ